jgi:hypothetical protein
VEVNGQLHAPTAKERAPGTDEIGSWVGYSRLKRFKKFIAPTRNRTTNPRSPNSWPRHYYIDYAIASSLLKHRECNKCGCRRNGNERIVTLHCILREKLWTCWVSGLSLHVSLQAPSYSSSHEFVFGVKAPRTSRTSCTNSLLSRRFHSTSFYSYVIEECDNFWTTGSPKMYVPDICSPSQNTGEPSQAKVLRAETRVKHKSTSLCLLAIPALTA